jgi:hypothetical protein
MTRIDRERNEVYFGALKAAVGRKIVNIIGTVAVMNGIVDDQPAHVWIDFDNDQRMGLSPASAGDISMMYIVPTPAYIDKDFQIFVISLSGTKPVSNIVGKEILEAGQLLNGFDNDMIGLFFRFEGDRRLYIVNVGDDLKLYEGANDVQGIYGIGELIEIPA